MNCNAHKPLVLIVMISVATYAASRETPARTLHSSGLAALLNSMGFDASSHSSSTAEFGQELDSLPRLLQEGSAATAGVTSSESTPGMYGGSSSSSSSSSEPAISIDSVAAAPEATTPLTESTAEQTTSQYTTAGPATEPTPSQYTPTVTATTDTASGSPDGSSSGVVGVSTLEAATRQPPNSVGDGAIPTEAQQDGSQPQKQLAGGHIAGIVVGVTIFAGLALLGWWAWQKHKPPPKEDYIGRYQRYNEIEIH